MASNTELIISEQLLEALSNANAAGVGGLIATTVTYPLDVIKVKLATSDGSKFSNELSCLKYVWETQGSQVFVRGLRTKLAWSVVGKWIFYGVYSALSTSYINYFQRAITFRDNIAIGYVTELITNVFSLPFEEISTVLQSSESGTLSGAFASIYKEHGILGFYRSFTACLFVSLTPALVTTFFTTLKDSVLAKRTGRAKVLSTLESFVLGAIARCLGVLIMFPLDRIKSIMQADVDGDSNGGIGKVIKAIYEQGFFSMYRGLRPSLVRGVLSSAVTLMIKERLYNLNRAMLTQALSRPKVALA